MSEKFNPANKYQYPSHEALPPEAQQHFEPTEDKKGFVRKGMKDLESARATQAELSSMSAAEREAWATEKLTPFKDLNFKQDKVQLYPDDRNLYWRREPRLTISGSYDGKPFELSLMVMEGAFVNTGSVGHLGSVRYINSLKDVVAETGQQNPEVSESDTRTLNLHFGGAIDGVPISKEVAEKLLTKIVRLKHIENKGNELSEKLVDQAPLKQIQEEVAVGDAKREEERKVREAEAAKTVKNMLDGLMS